MYRSLFKHEWSLMWKSKKNVFFIIFLFLLMAGYCFIVLPDSKTVHTLDHEELEESIITNEPLIKSRLEKGYTGQNSFTKQAAYHMFTADNDRYSRLLYAYENDQASRYLQLKIMHTGTVISTPNMFEGSTYPNMDRMHFDNYTTMRYQALLDDERTLTFASLEQKTAVQLLEQLFMVGGPFLLFVAIYFSGDVLIRDRSHATLKQGFPISWYQTINVKSGVAFLYTLVVTLTLIGVGILMMIPVYGLGSFHLSIPYLTSYNDVTLEQYDYMSMIEFLLQSVIFLVILLFLFVRLTMSASLLFKKSWLVMGSLTILLLFERVLRDRTSDTVFGVDVGYLPQTYFDFGKVAAHEMNYLFLTDSISFARGIIILGVLIMIVEAINWGLCKIRSKQRFFA